MASSGTILLIGKGDYSSTTEYKRLNYVRFNNATWVCKKTCVGIEPNNDNTDYWQILAKDGEKSDIFIGSTEENDGESGIVPKPLINDRTKFLRGDGQWADVDLNSKANGFGITFSVQNGIPYMSYIHEEEDVEITNMINNIFDNDNGNDVEEDEDTYISIQNIFDDDISNDEGPYTEVDDIINNIFG